MQSLLRAYHRRGQEGQPLPDVFGSLANVKARHMRGHVTLTSAAPGAGKSAVALTEVIRMQVPTLYLAPDADRTTTCMRAVQVVHGITMEQVERAFNEKAPWVEKTLGDLHWLRFAFPSSPDIREVVERVWAYAEAEGDWPHMIVVDNLMDIEGEGENEFAGLRRIMSDLPKLAKQTLSAVHVLHHVNGEYEDSYTPIPMKGINGKVSKKPTLIRTINWGGQDGQLWVSIVKNRFGPVDPAGFKVRAELRADYSRMQVHDPYVVSAGG